MDGSMKFSYRNSSVRFAFLTILCCLLAGCSVDPFGTKEEVRQVRTSTSEDTKMMTREMRRLQEELDNLSTRFDRFSSSQEQEMLALKASVNRLEQEYSRSNASLLSEVDAKIIDLDAKRVADKNQLITKINSVVDQLNALARKMKAASAATTDTEIVAGKGFYYTVEDNDTLWGIARKFRAEYGVTVEAIQQANNMDASNSRIVPGQKIIIPVKE
jgi:LysM repeat protein